ncbi:stomatin-like protein 1 [Xenopus tropicalis]|uniref:Podocin n=1 Tax=Xenopus tropicalis TaxID=8364 RepID=Q28CP1_XENTR|eukprot:NP_001039193.1 stomatin-like protein 1 [Xenopus tropicalis]
MWGQYKYTALSMGLDEGHLPQSHKSVPSDTWLMWCCHTAISCLSLLFLIVTFPLSAWCFLKMVPDYQRIVIFRLGRVQAARGPGLVLLFPLIDQFQRVDMRTKAFSVPPSKVKSRDGVLVSMGADIQFCICDPVLSVLSVQDLNFVTRNTAQNLMTQSLGRKYLREIQNDRARIAEHLKEDLNEQVKPWGLCVERVELALESILQTPENALIVPSVTPAVPCGGIDQLLMQFLALTRQSSGNDSPSLKDTDLSLKQLLSKVEASLTESLVSEVGSSYQLYVTMPGGQISEYFLDLKSGSGNCGWGVHPCPDVTLEMTEADLMSLICGDLHPLTAYTGGRLRVSGNIQTALQLERVLRAAWQ